MIATVLTLAILAAAAASPAPATIRYDAGRQARAIAVEVVGDGLVFVPGELQGNKAWFLLDTGSPSVLSQSLAAKLGLAGEDGFVASGSGESPVSIRTLHDVKVAIPGAQLVFPSMSSFDLERLASLLGHRIDGILGSTFFDAAIVEVDVPGKSLSVEDPASGVEQPEAAVLPVKREGGLPYVAGRIALRGRPALEGSFLIDTGADSAAILFSPFVDRHRLLSGAKTAAAQGSGVAGGNVEALVRADSVTLGPFVLKSPVVSLSRSTRGLLADPLHAGLIGTGLLSRFRAIFDCPHGRLLLRKNGRFAEPFRHDASGLALAAQGKDLSTFEVRGVAPASPASEAGLLAGDVVLAVDGKPAKAVGLPGLREMLRQDGQTYTLSVFRQGQIRKFALTCRRLL